MDSFLKEKVDFPVDVVEIGLIKEPLCAQISCHCWRGCNKGSAPVNVAKTFQIDHFLMSFVTGVIFSHSLLPCGYKGTFVAPVLLCVWASEFVSLEFFSSFADVKLHRWVAVQKSSLLFTSFPSRDVLKYGALKLWWEMHWRDEWIIYWNAKCSSHGVPYKLPLWRRRRGRHNALMEVTDNFLPLQFICTLRFNYSPLSDELGITLTALSDTLCCRVTLQSWQAPEAGQKEQNNFHEKLPYRFGKFPRIHPGCCPSCSLQVSCNFMVNTTFWAEQKEVGSTSTSKKGGSAVNWNWTNSEHLTLVVSSELELAHQLDHIFSSAQLANMMSWSWWWDFQNDQLK